MPSINKQPAGASIPELAVDYKVSERTLYALANRDELPGCRRLGKRFVCHRLTFEQWLIAGIGDANEEDDDALGG